MKKGEYTSEAAYKKMLTQSRNWRNANQEKAIANSAEAGRQSSQKGGKYYEKHLQYHRTGLQGERNRIRAIHRSNWHQYKHIIAPDSQIHHSWRPNSAGYEGVALVEKDAHMHGIIKVIKILEGEITLFTEEAIKARTNGQVNSRVYVRGDD